MIYNIVKRSRKPCIETLLCDTKDRLQISLFCFFVLLFFVLKKQHLVMSHWLLYL